MASTTVLMKFDHDLMASTQISFMSLASGRSMVQTLQTSQMVENGDMEGLAAMPSIVEPLTDKGIEALGLTLYRLLAGIFKSTKFALEVMKMDGHDRFNEAEWVTKVCSIAASAAIMQRKINATEGPKRDRSDSAGTDCH